MRKEEPATFMGVACSVVAALLARKLVIESVRLKESLIEVDRKRPGVFRLIPVEDLRAESDAIKVEACARQVLYKFWEQAPNHVKADDRAEKLAHNLMDRKRNSPFYHRPVQTCIAEYVGNAKVSCRKWSARDLTSYLRLTGRFLIFRKWMRVRLHANRSWS